MTSLSAREKKKNPGLILYRSLRKNWLLLFQETMSLPEEDLKETLPYPQVYFTKNSGLRPVIDQLFEQTGGTPKIAYEILEDASMAGLVAENFGIAVMPEIPILKNLNVDVLDIENPPYERYIYLAKLKEKYLAPVVKEFIEYVKESNGKAL